MKPTSFRKTLIAAALIGATALGASTAAAPQQGGYGMGPGMMGGMGYGMLHQLNLTAEPWNKVNEIHCSAPS